LVKNAQAVSVEGTCPNAVGESGGKVRDSVFVIGEVHAALGQGVGGGGKGGGLPCASRRFQKEVFFCMQDGFKEGPLLGGEVIWNVK